ncbi:MAG TPA: glycoside hydrolase family 99-like domain-containing protein [Candidatus Paceibacterota bacterium]|nr:glycoside hydrolase family 99-like domain-containing protein [Verrucomicrobiota bacterium]HOX03051.1 glycoside hydrolase family 99-like domain-containing protein [Verrucomicrobiota bacterium]HRZ45941.1 glycoside hydrolase family 99-like domain-containing protein [Candidatus Paceibacterota bacterium]HRZ94034.1 glycoside hydrolase family 99-like domain-containing protein [Candidatus Paceibacterota bacterium]
MPKQSIARGWCIIWAAGCGLAMAQGAADSGLPRTIREWRFNQPGNALGWVQGRDLQDVRVDGRSLRARGAGPDPTLGFTGPLDIAASPWQAIEVRLKADRGGTAEWFWTGDTNGPNRGLSQEKRTPFAVEGSDRWQTYRVFPFWHREGRLRLLRFDPYDGGRFEIEFIRIIELPSKAASAGRAADWGADRSYWQAMRDAALRRAPNGFEAGIESAEGFVMGPALDFEAAQYPVISLVLASSTAEHASVVFAASDQHGLQEYSMPILRDGLPHRYNLDLRSLESWRGRIRAVGLRPGVRAGDSCVLTEIRFAERALGQADLQVRFFGLDDPFPRTGSPATIRARAGNGGGEPVLQARPRLALPASARLLAARTNPVPELRFGEEAEWTWDVQFDRPSRAVLDLRVDSDNAGTARAARTNDVIAPRRLSSGAGLPAPVPVRSSPAVGVYYFPGWNSAMRWTPITRYPERRPLLGWYQEGRPEVMDWQIRWAVEHGISFFAFDWYWSRGARQLEHALHDGYFQSRYRSLLPFCLLWANHNPEGSSSIEDCRAVARHWIDQYFRRPEYYRLEGRPLVVIFSMYRLQSDLGTEGARGALEAMREECRRQGLPPVYLMACVNGIAEAREAEREGYDAITAYNWPTVGMRGQARWSPYEEVTAGYRQQWKDLIAHCRLPLAPPVSGGWDSRPWHGQRAIARYGRAPASFRAHLREAADLIRENPRSTLPLVMIEAWNEWGEGSYIEPHNEAGFGYLDAIREVLTSAPARHVDWVPADAGLSAPQVEFFAADASSWDFTQGTWGWESGRHISTPRSGPDGLSLTTTGDDPALFSPALQWRAGQWGAVRIRMRATDPRKRAAVDFGQVFWTAGSESLSEAASVRFTFPLDGQWHEHTVPLAGHPRWRETITSLRIDLGTRPGIEVSIRELGLAPR